MILTRLAAGDVTLTSIRLLAPHFTDDNHLALLEEARHCSKPAVEEIVARLQPHDDVPSSVRKLPAPAPPGKAVLAAEGRAREDLVPTVFDPDTAHVERPRADPSAPSLCATDTAAQAERVAPGRTNGAPAPAEGRVAQAIGPTEATRSTLAPLAPARYKVSFTIGAETLEKLRQAQALLRHVVPSGDVAALFDRALTTLLSQAAKTKLAATDTPRSRRRSATRSHRIPAEVKRRVWARDGGQCTFMGRTGHRCAEHGFLQFHHVVPYALGARPRLRISPSDAPPTTDMRPSAPSDRGRSPVSANGARAAGQMSPQPLRRRTAR